MLILMFTFMIVTATVHRYFGLDWLDAFYVTVQSYTTIGFGDIPLKKFKSSTVIFFIVWDSLGMTLIAALFNALMQLQSFGFTFVWKGIQKVKGRQQNTSYDVQQENNRNQQDHN